MPEDPPRPVLRDTLYLDVVRVRSILAQIQGGIVERQVERWTASNKQSAGLKLFGLSADAGRSSESTFEQTIVLEDALLGIFEEALEEAALFTPADVTLESAWRSGQLHQHLHPGQLLRVTAPTQILDASHVKEQIARAVNIVQGLSIIEEEQNPTGSTVASAVGPGGRPKHKPVDPEAAREAAVLRRMELTLGSTVRATVVIGELLEEILGDGVSVRCFPCGLTNRDLAIEGKLDAQGPSLRDRPATLFPKYGYAAEPWTMIGQLATVPTPPFSDPVEAVPVVSSNEIDRAGLEDLTIGMMREMETTGLISAPAWPRLTITPLALYRQVPAPSAT